MEKKTNKAKQARLKTVHRYSRTEATRDNRTELIASETTKNKASRTEGRALLLADGTAKSEARSTEQSECRASVLALESAKGEASTGLPVHRNSRAEPRGQISAEFVITIMILFLMFSAIVFVSIQQKENLDFSSKKIKAKTLLEKTTRAVDGIYLAGNGSQTLITKEFDFELEFEENSLKVKYGQGQFVSAGLLTKRIIFISKADAGEIRIKNLDGVIEVEEL
ncbi:MAG: hypothetical protein ABH850_01425 [Candidatus Micrarchaeota archaeon]